MNNFTYYNPTKIHFGRGCIDQLGTEITNFGFKKVLLVYGGGSIKKSGLYDNVIAQLEALKIEVVEHAGVQGNPILPHVRAGIELAKSEGVDLILGVGGGSVVDSSKAIALGAVADCDVWEFFAKREVPTKTLPVIDVLTLPATGSEMNGICVVTNTETDEKSGLAIPGLLNPLASFLDPETTFSLSMTQTAYACTDILSHIMEGYLTTAAEDMPIQDSQMEGVMLAVKNAMDVIMNDPENYVARADFMWSATLAWSGICHVGVPAWGMPNHALEMPLSAIYDIAHGAGLSIIIPAWIRVAGEQHKYRILKFGRQILGVDLKSVDEVADALFAYYQRIGSPVSCAEAGIDPDIERLTDLAYIAFKNRGMSNYTRETIKAIFESARGIPNEKLNQAMQDAEQISKDLKAESHGSLSSLIDDLNRD